MTRKLIAAAGLAAIIMAAWLFWPEDEQSGGIRDMGATYLAAGLADFPVLISPWTLAGAVLIAIFIDAFFGYYPARRASKLDPIEALRFE